MFDELIQREMFTTRDVHNARCSQREMFTTNDVHHAHRPAARFITLTSQLCGLESSLQEKPDILPRGPHKGAP